MDSAAQKQQERGYTGFLVQGSVPLCDLRVGPPSLLCARVWYFHFFTSPKELSHISKVHNSSGILHIGNTLVTQKTEHAYSAQEAQRMGISLTSSHQD